MNPRNRLAAYSGGDLDLFGEVTIHTFTHTQRATTSLVIGVLHSSLVNLWSVPKIKFDSNITIIYNIYLQYIDVKKKPSLSLGVLFWGGKGFAEEALWVCKHSANYRANNNVNISI